ncbi:MAG: hypothetical protein RR061_07555 [Muribaculaceae bacterium]
MKTQGMRIVEFGFSVDEILKCVFAESAWRALRDKDANKRPAIITEDNRIVLEFMMQDAYVNICSRFIGYIKAYDFRSIDTGIMTLSLAIPEQLDSLLDSILQKRIEHAMTCYVLYMCYDTEGYSVASDEYHQRYSTAINSVRGSLTSPTTARITLNWL